MARHINIEGLLLVIMISIFSSCISSRYGYLDYVKTNQSNFEKSPRNEVIESYHVELDNEISPLTGASVRLCPLSIN
jgi:hypothetical protein